MADVPVALELRQIQRGIDRLTLRANRLDKGPKATKVPQRFGRVLVAVDDSKGATNALSWAQHMRATLGARLLLVHVDEPPSLKEAFATRGFSPERHTREELDVLTQAVAALGGRARDVDSRLLHGFPVPAIVGAAKSLREDIVVIGSRGHGPWRRLLLGSVADSVKTEAPCSVLIAKTRAPPRRIVAAVDGSRSSKRAAHAAIRLARDWDLPLSLLYVVPLDGPAPHWVEKDPFEATFGEEEWPRLKGLQLTFQLRAGRPAEAIDAYASRAKADLIVVGCRGLSGLRSVAPGSVSNRLAHAARASVLIVK